MATAPLLPDRVQTRRLLLRAWTTDDVEELAEAVGRNLEHLRPWMPWVADEPVGVAARRALVAGWGRSYRTGGDVVLGMWLDGVAVGSTGLTRRRGPGTLEIGYWLDESYQGRGLATEAAAALTTVGLRQPGVRRIEIHHDRANGRSRRVPERLGYTLEAESPVPVDAPGEVGIDCRWVMTVERWDG